MKRRLLNLLTALSLLLCAAVVVLWVRSFWAWEFGEWISRSSGDGQSVETAWVLGVARGVVTVSRQTELWLVQNPPWLNASQPGWTWHTRRLYGRERTTLWERLGFSYEHMTSSGHPLPVLDEYTLSFPFLLPVAALAALPVARCVRRLRRRPPPGLCSKCGYDLRATPDKCPECGAAASVSHGG
jgi:hypothetical protein